MSAARFENLVFLRIYIFTSLHGMQTRSSDENSVCLSVKRVICDKTKESCARIHIPHERPFTLVLWQEEWLVGATPSTWNFGSNWASRSDPIFSRYSLVPLQPYHLAKTVQLTLIGGPRRVFQ